MGLNSFNVIGILGPGSSGPGTAIDLGPLGRSRLAGFTLICKGEFVGQIDVEGSPDREVWASLAQFDAGADADGNPGPSLELSPKNVPAIFRYIRTFSRAAFGAGTQTRVSIGGELVCCCAGEGGSGPPVLLETLINGQPAGSESCGLPCFPPPIIEFVFDRPVFLQSSRREHPDVGGSIACPSCVVTPPTLFEFGTNAFVTLPSPNNTVRLQLQNKNNDLVLTTYRIEVTVVDQCRLSAPEIFFTCLTMNSGPCPPGP
jgi:hypothetical protein